MHIVDELIEERAQNLMSHPRLWKFIKTALYPALQYPEAKALADTVRDMSGLEVFQHLSDSLQLNVSASGLENVPREGCAVVVANHPVGIVDGIAVYDAIKDIRDDVIFLANRDAIRVAGGLKDTLIPVDWRPENRTHQRRREVTRSIAKAFRQKRLIVIFPSGRIARLTARGLRERRWQPTAITLARRYDCPMVPLHIRARNSALFYILAMLNTELRDMSLFREMFNKTGHSYTLTFGAAFQDLNESQGMLEALQAFVENELRAGRRQFQY